MGVEVIVRDAEGCVLAFLCITVPFIIDSILAEVWMLGRQFSFAKI